MGLKNSLLRTILLLGMATSSFATQGQSIDSLLAVPISSTADTGTVMQMYRYSFAQLYTHPHKVLAYGMKAACLSEERAFPKGIFYGYLLQYEYYAQLGNWSLAYELGEEALAYAKAYQNFVWQQKCYLELAQAAINLYLPHTDSLFLRAIHLADSLDLPDRRMRSLYTFGQWKHRAGDQEAAMPYLQEALSMAEEMENKRKQAIIINVIGFAWSRMGEHEKALETMRKALQIKQEMGEDLTMGFTWMAIGGEYFYMEAYDSARHYFLLALPAFEQMENGSAIAATHNNLSQIYDAEQNWVQAQKHLVRALEYYQKIDNQSGAIRAQTNLGKIEVKMGAAQQGLKRLYETVAAAEALEDVLLRNSVYKAMYETQADLGNYRSAFQYRTQYHQLKDSQLNAENLAAVAEIEARYEKEKQERSISELEEINLVQELSLLESEAESARRLRWIALLVFLLTICAVGTTFWFQRQRWFRQQERAALQQKLLRSQMNPHFLFNALNSIQRLYQDEELEAAESYVSDFGALLQGILTQSSENHISLATELETLQRYLRLEQHRQEHRFQYTIHWPKSFVPASFLVPPMILQPLVENAIWHGLAPLQRQGQIHIELAIQADKLIATISDNGVGLTQAWANRDDVHAPKALNILRNRLQEGEGLHLTERISESGEILGTRARLELTLLRV